MPLVEAPNQDSGQGHALFSQIRYLHWSFSHTHMKTMFQRQKERQSRIQNTGSTGIPEKEIFWLCMFNYAVLLWIIFLLSILFHSGRKSLPLWCYSVFAPRLLAGAGSAQHLGQLPTQLSIAAGPSPRWQWQEWLRCRPGSTRHCRRRAREKHRINTADRAAESGWLRCASQK